MRDSTPRWRTIIATMLASLRNSCCRWWLRFWPELLGCAAALAFAAGIVAHAATLPPSRSYLGFVQIDQLVYYACARELFENGNGLFYANPYSNLPASPRLYSHLYFLLVGWLWRLSGISFTMIDGGVRCVLGPVMLLLAARIFRAVHGWKRGANAMLALMLLGGGLAWFVAMLATASNFLVGDLAERRSGSWPSFLWFLFRQEFNTAEGGYGDWHINLFRNVTYAPEIFYHVLFFLAVLGFMRNQRALGCTCVFLTWWAHPYTGLLLALVIGCWLAIEVGRGDRSARAPLTGVVAITLLFSLYYGAILPMDPEHRSVYGQMKEFPATMLATQIGAAYGLLVVFGLLGLWPQTLSRLWQRPRMRLVLVWLAIAAALNFHDKILPFPALQPLHFSHGYLYVPLAIVAWFGIAGVSVRRWPKAALRKIGPLCWVLLIVHLPDNIIWTLRKLPNLPRSSLAFAPLRDEIAFLRAVDSVPTTETILDHALPKFSSATMPLVPVLTHHRAVRAHLFNTPFSEQKKHIIDQFRAAPSRELLRQAAATAILTTSESLPLLKSVLGDTIGDVLVVYRDAVLVKVRP